MLEKRATETHRSSTLERNRSAWYKIGQVNVEGNIAADYSEASHPRIKTNCNSAGDALLADGTHLNSMYRHHMMR